MTTFGSLAVQEIVGTPGRDSFNVSSQTITFGLGGKDRFSSSRGQDFAVLIGGSGADRYIANNNSALTIVDAGSSKGDTVTATGIGFQRETSIAFEIDNRHLVALDTATGQQLFLIDWQRRSNRIENIVLADGTYNYNFIANNVRQADNYFGNIAWQDIIDDNPAYEEVGLTSGSKINRLIRQAYERAEQLEASIGTNNDDIIRGTSADDTLDGRGGNDQLIGLGGSDRLVGGNGSDGLRGKGGRDLLLGGNGSDALFGNSGNDTLRGGDQSDELNGGRGNDLLSGGAGSDRLMGGGGRDIFWLELGAGRDRIEDFQEGQDRLGLSSRLSFEDLTIRQRGDSTLIKAGRDALAILQGVDAVQIEASDFVMA